MWQSAIWLVLFSVLSFWNPDTPTHIWRDRVSVSIRVSAIVKKNKKQWRERRIFLFNALPKLCSLYLSTASVKIFTSTYTFSWLEANKQQEVMMTEQKRTDGRQRNKKKGFKSIRESAISEKEDARGGYGWVVPFSSIRGRICMHSNNNNNQIANQICTKKPGRLFHRNVLFVTLVRFALFSWFHLGFNFF